MSMPPSICFACARVTTLDDGQLARCEAYPEGIPTPITNGQVDHRAPFLGDKGVQFRIRDDEYAADDLAVWEQFASLMGWGQPRP